MNAFVSVCYLMYDAFVISVLKVLDLRILMVENLCVQQRYGEVRSVPHEVER
jgi:hypothetical protein